jgi:hypothetical protein
MRHGIILATILAAFISSAQAGNLHSKAGATATVSSRYADQFQHLIDDLEASGARITFMGGIRPGRCAQDSKHPCGMALDVCQYRRGIVEAKCRLPSPSAVSAIASRHGLFSGGDWCSSDYGHFEAGGSVACHGSWARSRGTIHEAHSKHRHSYAAAEYIGSRSSHGPGDADFH